MPKEPNLPEDKAEFRRRLKRVVWPWGIPGLLLALAGVALLWATAFESAIGAAMLGAGFGLEFVAIAKARRFRRAYIASHPL